MDLTLEVLERVDAPVSTGDLIVAAVTALVTGAGAVILLAT